MGKAANHKALEPCEGAWLHPTEQEALLKTASTVASEPTLCFKDNSGSSIIHLSDPSF